MKSFWDWTPKDLCLLSVASFIEENIKRETVCAGKTHCQSATHAQKIIRSLHFMSNIGISTVRIYNRLNKLRSKPEASMTHPGCCGRSVSWKVGTMSTLLNLRQGKWRTFFGAQHGDDPTSHAHKVTPHCHRPPETEKVTIIVRGQKKGERTTVLEQFNSVSIVKEQEVGQKRPENPTQHNSFIFPI